MDFFLSVSLGFGACSALRRSLRNHLSAPTCLEEIRLTLVYAKCVLYRCFAVTQTQPCMYTDVPLRLKHIHSLSQSLTRFRTQARTRTNIDVNIFLTKKTIKECCSHTVAHKAKTPTDSFSTFYIRLYAREKSEKEVNESKNKTWK